MATQKRSATAVATKLMEHSGSRPGRLPFTRMVQNFLLLWLDESIDEDNNDDCRNSIAKLRQVVNTITTFTDVDKCIDFIDSIKEERIFMISSGAFGQTTVPLVHEKPQVSTIYIFCGDKTRHEKWALQWPKVKGVFTDIALICEALKQAAYDCDQNMVSISFVKSSNGGTSKENLDQLDQSFMCTQILKEIILAINFEQQHIDEFLTYCQEQFLDNTTELKNVEKLRKEYRDHQSIWWYTYDCFLYSMLNKSLRVMDIDLIIKMGFFIRDLHKHITALHSEQYGGQNHSNSFIVYRGQALSSVDLEQLMTTQGGLLSFNNFLSTSKDRNVSFDFAQRTIATSNMMGIVFVMRIDPSLSATPFAKIRDVSAYEAEEEILFSIHSIFRVGPVQQLDGSNRLWQVEITLTSDNDPQLLALTEYISREITGSTGWDRLGHLIIRLGQFNKGEGLYEILLQQTTDEGTKTYLHHMLGMIKKDQRKYAEAIQFFEKALAMWRKTFPPNHLNLANSYGNIGSVYDNMGEYSKALSYFEKALEIRQNILSPNHPNLATSYNNLGSVYDNMGEYSKALSYYKKAFEILQNTLPPNHPNLATSYNNLGSVYDNLGEYSKALLYYEIALEIRQKTLLPNLPHLAASYNNIGSVHYNMREYSKALSYYEKALEMLQNTLSPNHPDLAASYNNIGSVYNNMGDYSKALSYHQKALEILQNTLPPNHPDLATSYNNIGSVYYDMGEYSKALSYYEKALEIEQNILPEDHVASAISYNNIGSVYSKMGEYLKALSYCERAVDIGQRSLPANHSRLQIYRKCLENVKRICK